MNKLNFKHVWLYDATYGDWNVFQKEMMWGLRNDPNDYRNFPTFESYKQNHNDNGGSPTNDRMLMSNYALYGVMDIGDIILVRKGVQKILGYGVVTSEYIYDGSRDYVKSYRHVEWYLKETEAKIKHQGVWFCEIKRDQYVPLFRVLNFPLESPEELYKKLIDYYKRIHKIEAFNGYEEVYKWKICNESKDSSPLEVVNTLIKHSNLLYKLNASTLSDLLKKNSVELENCVQKLYDESTPLESRLNNYNSDITTICPQGKSVPSDERTASSLLAIHDFQKYPFYMNRDLYKPFCEYMGVIAKKSACYPHYLELINGLASVIDKDEELKQMIKDSTNGYEQSNLLTAQTILWCLKDHWDKLYDTKTEQQNMKYQEYINLLKENYNLILTGAPGTGKTYMAKAIAEEMGAVTEFVQFHPSYDYTDFVEGLRPIEKGEDQVGFRRMDGIFKQFCKKAILDDATEDDEIVKNNGGLKGKLVNKEKPYVMIIDEINRGELSKIFGELFYAIDPGYRGTKGKVKTQYQNLIDESDVFADGFYIPENVYILATMNDIDRSVESMDFAMRRRFTWKEVMPNDTVDNIFEGNLDSALASSAKDTMKRLNKEIAKADGLGEAFMIGPSYFLKLKKYNGDFEKLWKMNIEPLLKEYLRGFRKANDTLEGFKNVYFNNVNKEEQTSEDNSNIVEDRE